MCGRGKNKQTNKHRILSFMPYGVWLRRIFSWAYKWLFFVRLPFLTFACNIWCLAVDFRKHINFLFALMCSQSEKCI